MKFILSIYIVMSLAITGCTQISSYESSEPSAPKAVDLMTFFSGGSRAWGMVTDYRGKVVRRFEVDLSGCMEGGRLVLDEHFVYDDGETQFRQWKIERTLDGRTYTGEAADIVGSAEGVSSGFALQWRYTMDLPVDGSVYRVNFDDWMYQLDSQHLFNIAKIKKWGVTVAKVTLFFQKSATATADCSASDDNA